MAGIEIPGIALASFSLAFQLLSGCIEGYEFLADVRSINGRSSALKSMLKLEEHRFHLWGRRSGLDQDQLDKRLDRAVVTQTLCQMKNILTDTEQLRTKYSLVPLGAEDGSDPSNLTNAGASEQHNSVLNGTALDKKDLGLKRRCAWAVRDKKRFEALLSQLHTFMNTLYELLDGAQQDAIMEELGIMQLRMINLTNKVEDIHTLRSAFDAVEGSQSTASSCATVKALRIELEGSTTTSTGSSKIGVSVGARSLRPLRPRLLGQVVGNSSRGAGTYNKTPIFIEWKAIPPEDMTGDRGVEIENRIALLATLLHAPKAPSFRSLFCLGYFEDVRGSRYGFLYSLPPEATPMVTPTSLFDLFHEEGFKPSLSLRLRLALDISTTLLHLHATGWLHKGLRSDNILFFQTASQARPSLSLPYVMGYEYARFDSSQDITQKPPRNIWHDIYRHPSAQGDSGISYNKTFDIYSLGLILLEIAQWKPLRHIVRKAVNFKEYVAEDIKAVRGWLLDSDNCAAMTEVAFRTGDIFCQVVQFCLDGRHGSRDIETLPAGELQDVYVLKVVKELERCRL